MGTVRETVETLRANIDNLPAKDLDFALSLISAAFSRKGVSEKQAYWLGVLANRATGKEKPAPAVNLGDVSGIVALLDKAGKRLKYPAFIVRPEGGEAIRVSVAGARAKVPGAINVTSPDGGFGERVWYGRVTRDGKFQPSGKVPGATVSAVALALQAMADDPAGTAAAYGKATGCCCFCSRKLDDPRSIAVGYGPVCAANYGLPH